MQQVNQALETGEFHLLWPLQDDENLKGPEELPNTKPMMELDAGSNVWYQAYVLKESINEAKVRFPGERSNIYLQCCHIQLPAVVALILAALSFYCVYRASHCTTAGLRRSWIHHQLHQLVKLQPAQVHLCNCCYCHICSSTDGDCSWCCLDDVPTWLS